MTAKDNKKFIIFAGSDIIRSLEISGFWLVDGAFKLLPMHISFVSAAPVGTN